jgi:predicted RNA-binding protein associated with RNAse of E/G family
LAVQYVLPQSAAVGPLVLPAGAETVAHYWSQRPYTAYHWRTADRQTLGVYLNAADQVDITPGLVRWRDLALDVLITPDGRVEVLDEDEARRAPPWAQPMIARARAALAGRAGLIAAEVQRLTEWVQDHGGSAHRR